MIAQVPGGRAVSYRSLTSTARRAVVPRRFDALFTNLDYNGGPVMPSNTNYTVYWAPEGLAAYPAGYASGLKTYFEDLAHDSGKTTNVDSVAAQYNDAEGHFANYQSSFGGQLIDTHPYPANGCSAAPTCLTDAQIQHELEVFIGEQKLPTDLEHEYFLLTPKGVESCFEEASKVCSAGSSAPFFCAYHGNIPLEGGAKQLIYANDPFVVGIEGCDAPGGNHPNESPSDGALFGGLSHEHNESLTDPEPNNAWTDIGGETGEIGDKCVGEEGAITGEPIGKTKSGFDFNQEINGHPYWYQEEWSNQGHECLQRLTFEGAEPTATFTSESGGGTEVQFDATGSTAPGGVFQYNWQFNDGPGLAQPTETAGPTVSHTFPVACKFTVALTVFAKDGTSIGTAKEVELKRAPPTAAFSAASSAATGQPVSFDASSSSEPCEPIHAYTWSFGDGSPDQTGVTTAHAFGAPGSYEVTLTVEGGTGLTASVKHKVNVTSPASGGGEAASAGGGPAGGVTPPPVIVLTGKVALLSSRLQIGRAGRSTVSLSCAGAVSHCSGSVTLTATVTVRRNGRRHRRTVTIGSARFTISTASRASVSIALNSLGRQLLRNAHGHLHASMLIHTNAPVTTAAAGHPVQLAARSH